MPGTRAIGHWSKINAIKFLHAFKTTELFVVQSIAKISKNLIVIEYQLNYIFADRVDCGMEKPTTKYKIVFRYRYFALS